jgi:FtsP/CotA-like multicopper oxidase with cupredoxin domain
VSGWRFDAARIASASKENPPMNRFTAFLPAALAAGLVACASAPAPAPAPAPALPEALQPAAGQTLLKVVAARGVQVYECRAKKDSAGTEWAFVAPEAELLDASGQVIGKHYAGPHWEANDGSKVKGSVKARADAPQAGAIPWLLLATESDGPAGRWAGVASIQRVNTVGGVAPATPCSAAQVGQQARVPYTADYRLFVAG